MHASLASIDWLIIIAYLLLALVVGLAVARQAGSSLRSYFMANGSLPWWWAGTSIAATTFAADTPLAVTGLVAAGGLAANWIWLAWGALHVGVLCFFADRWRPSGALTDAELVTIRYRDRAAPALRVVKALLYGGVINCIILGWVLRAMANIVAPYVHWEQWTPGLVEAAAAVLPASAAVHDPGALITIALLTALVGVYSAAGGIRGVVITDLLQFALGLVGAVVLAVLVVDAAGGMEALRAVPAASGAAAAELTPGMSAAFAGGGLMVGGALTALYLMVQAMANNPADGGGFMMQRLGSTRSGADARRASALFIVLNYLVRPWPWFLVALAALVLVPLGGEPSALGGSASAVADNRELAYPLLIAQLAPDGLRGVILVSLTAAFMSTVDTHINWGASYLANDVVRAAKPGLSERGLLRASRGGVIALAAAAVISALHITTIEGAWKTLAALGAGLAAPTALRWLWWRVTAGAELAAIGASLATWVLLGLAAPRLAYEAELIAIGLVGAAACVIASLLMTRGMGKAAPRATIGTAEASAGVAIETGGDADAIAAAEAAFVAKIAPIGAWREPHRAAGRRLLAQRATAFVCLVGALYGGLFATRELLLGTPWLGALLLGGACGLAYVGWQRLEASAGVDEASNKQ